MTCNTKEIAITLKKKVLLMYIDVIWYIWKHTRKKKFTYNTKFQNVFNKIQ